MSSPLLIYEISTSEIHQADFLLQSGLAKEIRFHGKRYPWFVSDVTKKDWNWLMNTMVYGHLFPKATEEEKECLRRLGRRWKVRVFFTVSEGKGSGSVWQRYEEEGKWIYEQHPFWCTGYTFWDLHNEAPDLFLHLSKSNLVIFKGDLNHRKVCRTVRTRNDQRLIPFQTVDLRLPCPLLDEF